MSESTPQKVGVAVAGTVIGGLALALLVPSVPSMRTWIGREAPAAWGRATATFSGDVPTTIFVTAAVVALIFWCVGRARGRWYVWRVRDQYQFDGWPTFRDAMIPTASAGIGVAFLAWIYVV